MDFKNELAKYGYNINNSIPVETLVNEILPKLFSVQDEKMYSDKDLDTFRKFMIQEQNFSKSCLDVFVRQFKKK
jgi:hypothetical protein